MAVMGVPESLAYAEIAGLPHVPWPFSMVFWSGDQKLARHDGSLLQLRYMDCSLANQTGGKAVDPNGGWSMKAETSGMPW